MLSARVLYARFSGISGRISPWTWTAVALVLIEGLVLVVSGWTFPLTLLAERLGTATRYLRWN